MQYIHIFNYFDAFPSIVLILLKKCGISLSLDCSENGEIHIESTEEYELLTANEVTESELNREREIEDRYVLTPFLGYKIPPLAPVIRPPGYKPSKKCL